MRFLKQINQKMMLEDNTWRLRNEYIVAHNIRYGLRTIRNYYKSNYDSTVDVNELTNILLTGKDLFSTDYRNCMMHYNLVSGDDSRIKEEFFSEDKVFFGLIESCFGGKDYNEYYSELRQYMLVVESYLNNWFNIEYSRIKWDL